MSNTLFDILLNNILEKKQKEIKGPAPEEDEEQEVALYEKIMAFKAKEIKEKQIKLEEIKKSEDNFKKRLKRDKDKKDMILKLKEDRIKYLEKPSKYFIWKSSPDNPRVLEGKLKNGKKLFELKTNVISWTLKFSDAEIMNEFHLYENKRHGFSPKNSSFGSTHIDKLKSKADWLYDTVLKSRNQDKPV